MRVDVPLRWADLDAQGHVNNGRFIDYLQDARADFLAGTPAGDLIAQGLTVVNNQIEYRAPIQFSNSPIQVDVSVCAVAADSVWLAYTLWQNERETAVARTKLAAVDLATHQRRDLPEPARAYFASIVEPLPPLRAVVWLPMTAAAKATPMRVRWSDLDAYGQVNNAMMFDYIQEGRIAFTAAAVVGLNDSPDEGYLWFVVRQDVAYLTRIVFRQDPYMVRTGVAHMGRTSLTFCSQIDDPQTGTICAQASTVAVFADGRGQPVPVLEQWKQALEAYRLD